MAYYLTSFDNVTFPLIQPITEMPTVAGMNGAINTIGGGFDAWGDDAQPAQFPLNVQYRVTVYGATAAAYETAINALRALGRKRAYLCRTGQNGTIHRALARCLRVSALDSIETFNAIEVTLDFELWEHWGSDWALGWDFDDGYFFDTGLFFDATPVTTVTLTGSPQTISVTNAGNIPVEDCIILLTAGNANITAVEIKCVAQHVRWTWTGTLAAGANLIVDCGALVVENATADAYAGFVLHADHLIVPWLRLAPGANSIIATYTGGGAGSVISFSFADRWA